MTNFKVGDKVMLDPALVAQPAGVMDRAGKGNEYV